MKRAVRVVFDVATSNKSQDVTNKLVYTGNYYPYSNCGAKKYRSLFIFIFFFTAGSRITALENTVELL